MHETFESPMWKVLPSVFKPSHYDDYVRIFETLLSANEIDINQNQSSLFLINELLHLIVSDAYIYHRPKEEKTQNSVDVVCSYLKKNYMKDIKLDELAALVHLNKNHLVRQFKKCCGLSPISYLIQIRMDYAKKLLAESNLPIKTIASLCGYNDPSFFNSYFKKIFSITPSDFRRMHQEE